MNNTFEFVGKIIPCKETDSFKPYSTIWFKDSEWGKKSIKFNMVCGTNRHILEVSCLINKDENKMDVYTQTKSGKDDNGNKIKGESIKIPFKDRLNPKHLETVAEYKKYVSDTEEYNRRYKLEKAIDKFKDGTIDDEQMDALNVHNIEEAEKALIDSKNKRKEFISAYDFIDFINKLANSEKAKNMIFKVQGNYEFNYDEKSDTWYRSIVPTRIYRAEDNAEQTSSGTFGFTFGRNSIDENGFEDTKKYKINGFLSQYVSSLKKSLFVPMSLTINGNGDEKAEKKAQGFKKKFSFPVECDCEYREIGLTVDILNGSQKVELTEDMLTEEQKENLEYGLITMDEIRKELGKDIYGDKVQDIIIVGLAKGYSSGAKDTAFTESDIENKKVDDNIFDEDDI